MSNRSADEQVTYAAASIREALLDGEVEEPYRHAGIVQDGDTEAFLTHLTANWDPDAVEADVPEDPEESELWQDVVGSAATSTVSDAVDAGNVSQMQFTIGLVDNSEDGDKAVLRAADALSNEGMIGLMVGSPGAGKTAFALDTARTWKALTGGTILSNIESWDGTDVVVHTNEEMTEEMRAVDGQVLVVLDEVAQVLTSRGEDSKGSDQMAKDLKYCRKAIDGGTAARASALMIGHTHRDTAKDIRRLATLVIQKPSRKDPGKVTIHASPGGQDKLEESKSYKGVTDTAESYSEHEASYFGVVLEGDDDQDVDIDDVVEDAERRAQIRTALKAVKPWSDDDGMSQAEVARKDIIEFGQGWVSQRVREWRDGQHRDLVADPTESE